MSINSFRIVEVGDAALYTVGSDLMEEYTGYLAKC
jgi:hypothetical protein